MKLNRVFSAVALFGLLGGAGMAAQAQTRFTVRIGTPAAAVVASYAPQYDGNGSVWISGYFDGGRWIPGYWTQRVDSRYRDDNHYSDHAARFDNNYGRNDRNYNRNENYGHNDGSYNRNDSYGWNGGDRGYNQNQRDNRNNGRDNRDGRDNRGGRH